MFIRGGTVTDTKRCMALKSKPKSIADLFKGEFCQAPATHISIGRRLCAEHAEDLRASMRSPHTVANIVLGRPRTEEEIALLVVELPS